MPPWMPSSGPGWVYVLTNPTLPGVCKIGRTRRTAFLRAREVSRAYGTAMPFEVASKHAVPDAAAIEWLAHRRLRRCRIHASELFECDAGRAAAAVHSAVLAYRPPSRTWRWLRCLLAPSPAYHRRKGISPGRRYRRGTNWLPLLAALSISIGGVMVTKPTPASWWPPPIARTVLLLERLH
jgi:hypothetical protein